MKEIVGGGAKKVLYTLNTVRRIGLKQSAKALQAKNACKACGLGMGGQLGGMTNELGEFPSVCNKSVQAQSTDIQPPIPEEIFNHSIEEINDLSAHDIEHLGRLNTPLYKTVSSNHFKPITWREAYAIAAKKFAETDPNRSFFYCSGRSSNEAGFLLQLMARLYGTNNINNCSYYCHQATGVGLGESIGTGTATIELEDLGGCDTFFLIGANPASNHPRLIHQLKALRDRGGDVIVINPAKEAGLVKFAVPKSPKSLITGGDPIASYYLQPKIGSDRWLMKGIAKAVLDGESTNQPFVDEYTNGFAVYQADIQSTSWEHIESQTGLARKEIEDVAECYSRAKNAVFAWGMGITHHQHGCDNVEAIANLALLRGMVGRQYAGLLPLRGHSNVQGIGTIGVKPVLAQHVIEALEDELDVKLPTQKGLDTMACLDAATNNTIDAALIMGGNLYSASPDQKWATKALENIGFKMFLTTTLNKGHVNGLDNSEALILPVAARDEEWQPTTQESMFNYVRLSDGGIERLSNVHPEVDILATLAKDIIPNSPVDFTLFKKHKDIRHVISKCIPGMEAIKDIDVARQEFHVQGRLRHKPVFKTSSGKANFTTHRLKAESNDQQKPFMLATIRSEGQFNSIIYEEQDTYRDVKDRWTVLMNPDDMKARRLQDGDKIDIESTTGTMQAVSVKAFDLPEGDLMAYYPEANILVGQAVDPRSRTPAFKSIAVSISESS